MKNPITTMNLLCAQARPTVSIVLLAGCVGCLPVPCQPGFRGDEGALCACFRRGSQFRQQFFLRRLATRIFFGPKTQCQIPMIISFNSSAVKWDIGFFGLNIRQQTKRGSSNRSIISRNASSVWNMVSSFSNIDSRAVRRTVNREDTYEPALSFPRRRIAIARR